jgi:hypothetical protein
VIHVAALLYRKATWAKRRILVRQLFHYEVLLTLSGALGDRKHPFKRGYTPILDGLRTPARCETVSHQIIETRDVP